MKGHHLFNSRLIFFYKRKPWVKIVKGLSRKVGSVIVVFKRWCAWVNMRILMKKIVAGVGSPKQFLA